MCPDRITFNEICDNRTSDDAHIFYRQLDKAEYKHTTRRFTHVSAILSPHKFGPLPATI